MIDKVWWLPQEHRFGHRRRIVLSLKIKSKLITTNVNMILWSTLLTFFYLDSQYHHLHVTFFFFTNNANLVIIMSQLVCLQRIQHKWKKLRFRSINEVNATFFWSIIGNFADSNVIFSLKLPSQTNSSQTSEIFQINQLPVYTENWIIIKIRRKRVWCLSKPFFWILLQLRKKSVNFDTVFNQHIRTLCILKSSSKSPWLIDN